ncbi:hypothetical protein NMG60_11017807 [Bertholletia excelsa]
MASASESRSTVVSEKWVLMGAATLIGAFFGYLVYDAIMSTAAELLQRVLIISPLLLIVALHCLSSTRGLTIPMPGSEPDDIHRAGASPWGLASVLLLLFFLISYQNGLLF